MLCFGVLDGCPCSWDVDRYLHSDVVPNARLQGHTLRLTWQLPSMLDLYRKKPLGYLAELVGHEGPGGILQQLKANHWATGAMTSFFLLFFLFWGGEGCFTSPASTEHVRYSVGSQHARSSVLIGVRSALLCPNWGFRQPRPRGMCEDPGRPPPAVLWGGVEPPSPAVGDRACW